MVENDELYKQVADSIRNMYVKVHAIYKPNGGSPFGDCYCAATDLFSPGLTFRLYFSLGENSKIEVEHLERWYMG